MGFFSKTTPSAPISEQVTISVHIEVTELGFGNYRIGQHPAKYRTFEYGCDELGINGNLYGYSQNGIARKSTGHTHITIKAGPNKMKEDGTFGSILFEDVTLQSPRAYLLLDEDILRDVIEEVKWRKPLFINLSGTRDSSEELKDATFKVIFNIFSIELSQVPCMAQDENGDYIWKDFYNLPRELP
jgi:hypothetical protein